MQRESFWGGQRIISQLMRLTKRILGKTVPHGIGFAWSGLERGEK
jgi:hypothetical protein